MDKLQAFNSNINKTPIEILLGVDENGMTTAKKLYEFLELDVTHYARWIKTNITKNIFATENVDFKLFAIGGENLTTEGRPTKDYKLSAAFAKKLSMASKSEKGEAARNYFIVVEEKLKQAAQVLKTPQTYIQALEALIEAEREKERLSAQNECLEIALNESIKYYTVAKYNKAFKMGWSMQTSQIIDKKMTGFCKARAIEIKRCQTNDERFGEVNSYPLTAWEDFRIKYLG